jgi:predicted carbohydrate-binding protein with CBM5 and CBM33 domain
MNTLHVKVWNRNDARNALMICSDVDVYMYRQSVNPLHPLQRFSQVSQLASVLVSAGPNLVAER